MIKMSLQAKYYCVFPFLLPSINYSHHRIILYINPFHLNSSIEECHTSSTYLLFMLWMHLLTLVSSIYLICQVKNHKPDLSSHGIVTNSKVEPDSCEVKNSSLCLIWLKIHKFLAKTLSIYICTHFFFGIYVNICYDNSF